MENSPVTTSERPTLPPLAFNSVPVLTTELLAQAYEVEPYQIRQNFKNNRDRFIEGKHYFSLAGEALKAFKNCVEIFDSVEIGKHAANLILWTERGCARHAKSLNTDRAWDMFELLEETFFAVVKSGQKQETVTDLPPSDQNIIQSLVKAIGDRYPEDEQRSVYMQVWMRFRNHFRIGSYKQLPPERMADAVAYLANLKINEKKKAIEPRNESHCPARTADDKYEAYIYDVEAFRAETAAKIETLLHRGLNFVDAKKLGAGGIIAFTPILLDWLQRIAGQPNPILRRNEPISRAIDYSPLYLIRHLEKVSLSR